MASTNISTGEGIAVAIGVTAFLCLIGVEYYMASLRGRAVHSFGDSVANLACGVIHQVVNVHYSSFVFPAYELLRQHCSIARVEHFSIASGIALFLLVDLIYYWEHRLLHWNRFLWMAHVVHHQSDEFNLTVSLRVSILQVWMTTASTMLLAIAGFSPAMSLTALLAYKFYQFWTHTQLIGRLGPLEWVFVTPSHHRVHHAKNERYLDKNFGGMLIIWDRMFGTFEPEREPLTYGVVGAPAPTFNPVLANLRPWFTLKAGAPRPQRDFAPVSSAVAASVVLRLGAVVGLAIALLLAEASSGAGTWLLVTLVSFAWLWQLGALLDARRVARRGDAASVLLALAASVAVASTGTGTSIVSSALVGGSALVLLASLVLGRHDTTSRATSAVVFGP
jgi:sterol desaturase/sphingolipid hydroxylase (fatty acid hydroxylase superfamily)